MASIIKRLLVGRPLASAEEAPPAAAEDHRARGVRVGRHLVHRLRDRGDPARPRPRRGLSVALSKLVPIAIVVMILLAIVVTGYRQTVFAYPSGGGSYIVSKENLGEMPSLVAGASLLVDYILTVAVSISAGVAAILSRRQSETCSSCACRSASPASLVMMLANLRGLKESGRIFAGPTYIYIFALGLLLVCGLFQSFTGHLQALPAEHGAARRS